MGQAESIESLEDQLPDAVVEAGVQVLHKSGYLEYESSSDDLLVRSIFSAMARASLAYRLVKEPRALQR